MLNYGKLKSPINFKGGTTMTTLEITVFSVVGSVLGISAKDVTSKTIIPAEMQTEVVERTVSATATPILLKDRANLTAGRIVEAVEKSRGR